MDKKVSARKREDKRRALFRTVWSYVLCLGAAALLFAYAFVHYDAETEANTYQVTTHLTDYALFTSRHGGITLQLSTEAGVFYYDVFYDSSPWNAVKEEERALTETLQPLADCRAEITVVVSDEKNYAYVTSYGLDALQAVEVRDAEEILFSCDGHNQDQKVRRIETIIAAGLLLGGFAAYRAVKRFLGACAGEPAAPWTEKKADSKKSGARIAGAGSCFVCCFAGAGGNQYIPPMSGAAGAAGAAFSGRSATRDSVVRTMEETDAAFSSALRQTLVGSTMPFSIMSPKVSCAAS